jgi:hypothetical protein
LNSDPNFNRWYTNLSKGSLIAADIRLRSLGRFCEVIKMTPKEYASLPQVEMEELAQDYLNKLESSKNPKTKAPYSPGYVSNCLDAIRSWANWNRKAFQRTIKISNPNRTPTLEGERAPTQEELRKVLYSDATPLRTRANIALIAFAGMRPEVQGDYLGLEGLRIKDFPEMHITKDGKVNFKKIPTMVVVREEISKIRKQYLTFLNEEGCEIISQYLERRINEEGEKLVPNSAVIAALRNQEGRQENFGIKDASPFLSTSKISEAIREAMRKCGLPWRPYVWRVYFDTALLVAEGKGLISHAFQQFIMGHSGDIERTYTLSKNRLPDQILEDIRRAVKRTAQFLETRRPKDSDAEMLKMLREGLLSLSKRWTTEEIQKLDLASMTNEEFFKLLQSRQLREITGGSQGSVIPANGGSPIIVQNENAPKAIQQGPRHTAIPIGQLESFLASGCKYVDKYTNEDGKSMAIVEISMF